MAEEQEYDDNISNDDINNLIDRANEAENKNVKLNQALNLQDQEKRDGNFLHFQLSTEEMLQKLEHFYRNDTKVEDEYGDIVWKTQEDSALVTFNDFGVSSIMEIVSKYIDKNTILSDYTEERIYAILGDIGEDLILFMLCNYVQMGMDTHFKKTKFRLIITTTTHIIESTYRRAKNGKTLQEINQSRVVGQFNNPNPQQQGRPRKEGFFSKIFN